MQTLEIQSSLTVANTRSLPHCLSLLPTLYGDLKLTCFVAGIMGNATPQPTCSVCLGLTVRADAIDYCEDYSTIAIFEASSEQGCWGCKAMVDLFHSQDLDHRVQYSMQLIFLLFQPVLRLAIWKSETEPKTLSTATRIVSIFSFPGTCFC